MKKQYIYMMMILACFALTSCFEDYEERHYYDTLTIEFQDAVVQNNAPGREFPILAQDEITEAYVVNMFGGHSEQSMTMSFRIVEEATTAVDGVHYNLPEGDSFVIEANESFGTVTIENLVSGAEAEEEHLLVLELVGNEDVIASENYKTIGISF